MANHSSYRSPEMTPAPSLSLLSRLLRRRVSAAMRVVAACLLSPGCGLGAGAVADGDIHHDAGCTVVLAEWPIGMAEGHARNRPLTSLIDTQAFRPPRVGSESDPGLRDEPDSTRPPPALPKRFAAPQTVRKCLAQFGPSQHVVQPDTECAV